MPTRSARVIPSGLGFGAAPIGNLYQPLSDDQAQAAVAAAIAAGITYFDTAPHYGFGLSETRLGAALSLLDPHETTKVSTKIGRTLSPVSAQASRGVRQGFAEAAPFESQFDYGYDAVMRSYEQSLQRLRRRRIDLLFAHDLGRATHNDDHEARLSQFMNGGYRALRGLRESGAVGAIGLGVNEVEAAIEVLAAADLDVILLAGRYTLLEQDALDVLLPLCARRGVSVIVGGPYNSGILARGAGAAGPLRYNYEPASAAVIERVGRLEAVCAQFGVPLAAAALQFPLAHTQVASVIPGLASAEEVAAARVLIDTPIPPELWRALRAEDLLRSDAPTPTTGGRRPTSPTLILLAQRDNVLVCAQPISAGQRLVIDGQACVAPDDVPMGHKIARWPLKAGDKVFKYGAPIGSMTAGAPLAAHIHSHNLASDYIPSHTRTADSGPEVL
jgi:D-threo-aldose 1-dehydrogenase